MIDPVVFKASREAARARLTMSEALESFGYYIDVANIWESYRSPEELLPYMGIHETHKADFPEIAMDLGPFTDEEIDWARRYVEFFDRLARVLTTTQQRPQFQFDLAETTFDWRTIRKFVDLPARILEFGAGCGRQCVSSFLFDPRCVYTAIDATLAAYTMQNLVFSFMDAMMPHARFTDFLDLETAGLQYPDIAQANPGDRFHLPGWFESDPVPERFFDIVLACHVHNELSRSDFMRLVKVATKGLADDGIFYVRSELGVRFAKNLFDAIDLHAVDIVTLLREQDIVPVYCKYDCTYQTTVFARKGSIHHQRALASDAPETEFTEIDNSTEMTVRAGTQFNIRKMEWAAENAKRVVLIGEGTHIYSVITEKHIDRIPQKLTFTEQEALDNGENFRAKIRAMRPDLIMSTGSDFFKTNANAVAATGVDFAIKIHRILPACFAFREVQQQPVAFLDGGKIQRVGDIEVKLGIERQERGLVGSEIFRLP